MRTYVRDESRIGIHAFQRAPKTGNLTLIRNAGGELPRVELADTLAVCLATLTIDRSRNR